MTVSAFIRGRGPDQEFVLAEGVERADPDAWLATPEPVDLAAVR